MPPKKALKSGSQSSVTSISKAYERVKNPKYFVGAHVSAQGGVQESVKNIKQLGGNAFALFLKNQQRWTSKPLQDEDVKSFHDLVKEFKYDPLKHIMPHSSYLINLGNPDDEKRAKAYDCFLDDLYRCEQLGIGLYNIHPGSSVGSDKQETISRIAKCINAAHKQTKFVKVVLENMAGHGHIIGSTIEDLRDMIDQIDDKERVGVCIDTCHTFAAGYDLRDKQAFDKFWKEYDEKVGLKYLSAIHLNDSKAPLGSNRDLHQNVGLGFLGLECFRLIMNDEKFQNLPLLLETPASNVDKVANTDSRADEMKLLEWLEGKKADDSEVVEKSKELQKLGEKDRKEQQAKYDKKQTEKSKKAAKGQQKLNFKRKRGGGSENENEASAEED